jgi:methylglyoxal synthase
VGKLSLHQALHDPACCPAWLYQEIDLLIFFWDPLTQQPHDSDVKALLRIAVVGNILVACNRASADFMISSPFLSGAYQRQLPDIQITQNG